MFTKEISIEYLPNCYFFFLFAEKFTKKTKRQCSFWRWVRWEWNFQHLLWKIHGFRSPNQWRKLEKKITTQKKKISILISFFLYSMVCGRIPGKDYIGIQLFKTSEKSLQIVPAPIGPTGRTASSGYRCISGTRVCLVPLNWGASLKYLPECLATLTQKFLPCS